MRASCKICRRVGMSICGREKCAFRRKPYPPGSHGRKGARRSFSSSEYGIQLREKQKMKFMYGLRERQFKSYVLEAQRSRSNSMEKLVGILESRLDNTVFRLGFATSRSTARQIVNHGHITVNGKRVTIPSLRVKRDDTIGIRTQSVGKGIFRDLDIYLKKHETPVWLSMDNDKREGKVLSYPSETDSGLGLNLNAIVEFYSR